MTDVLFHRGPDGSGMFLDQEIGLGHRRLAIVDLSDAGHQPMTSDCGRFVISFNGEIYNHLELRPRLMQSEVRFRGHSDTETLINHFAKTGLPGLSQLKGIFGFAIWDRKERELILARDQLGVKQVYYWDNGRSIVFASEIKAILANNAYKPRANHQAIGDYFHFHTPIDDRTFFDGIKVLRPGEFLRIRRNGSKTLESYLNEEDYTPFTQHVSEISSELSSTLRNVINNQLMSDVPLGCFLSGGIDSTLVAKFSADSLNGQLKTFGCYYKEAGTLDEEPYARDVASTLGLTLDAVYPSATDFPRLFEKALWHQDEPKIGSAMVSMWRVAELASKHVKVCLGGQGGDEIFGGYARYAMASPAKVLWRELIRRINAESGSPAATMQKAAKKGSNRKRLFQSIKPFGGWKESYFSIISQIPRGKLLELAPEFEDIFEKTKAFENFSATVERCASNDPIDQAMYWDRKAYLPGLFAQDDRMSMAHGLETRVPLADPRLVEFAIKIPNRWKLNGLSSKWILKDAIRTNIPSTVLNRQKAGFETPLKSWLLGEGRELTEDLLFGKRATDRELFSSESVRSWLTPQMDATTEQLLWKCINVEQWFRNFIDRPQPHISP